MIWALPLASAAIGAAQGSRAQEQEKRDRSLQAATARFSPWTKLAPQRVESQGDMATGAISGFTGGMGQSQSLEKFQGEQDLKKALANFYDPEPKSEGPSPWTRDTVSPEGNASQLPDYLRSTPGRSYAYQPSRKWTG
jgi:hypothetical protein